MFLDLSHVVQLEGVEFLVILSHWHGRTLRVCKLGN